MSIDKLTQEGKITAPNMVIYATGGRGKSSTASTFPNPIFLDADHSIDSFTVTKTPKLVGWDTDSEEHKFHSLKYWLDWLCKEEHDFKTVVLDTLDACEEYFVRDIKKEYDASTLNDDKIKALNFGKGSEILADRMRTEIFKRLSYLSKKKGMIVLVLAHQTKRTVKIPHADDYSQTCPLLEKPVLSALESWADIIGLLDVRYASTEDGKASTSKDAYVFTEKKEAYVAKQREGYKIPEILDARKLAETITNLIKEKK